MTDIKAKIDEMERISKEIQKELGSLRMSFRWSLDLQSAVLDREALEMSFAFRRFREELYGDLIKAGALPPGSGSADGQEPESR
ncbi:MAG: hypothetical protein LBP74_05745 [Treponema sp.]|jgi:hypothetical protein|nr:hypothetical protein [Treponema sp.]